MIRLKEAFIVSKENGKNIKKYALAQMLWGGRKRKSAATNMGNLIKGKSKRIDIEAVPIICNELGVSADYLFGLSDNPNERAEYLEMRNKIEQIKNIL